MTKSLVRGFFLCSLFLLALSCKQQGEIKSSGEPGEAPAVAKINGEEITLSEFNDLLKEYPSMAHGGALTPEAKKGLLENLIVRELFFQEAQRSGIDKEKDTVKVFEEMKKRVLIDRFFKKEVDEKVGVTDEEARKFYDEHPEETKKPEEVHALHILLKSREEAETVKKKIKEGSKFEDLAKKFSIDPGSKDSGGDLGFFSRGVMVPEFEQASFGLKEGEVSDIVQTRFGFHIIKVLEKREGGQRSFDEARNEIEKSLLSTKRKERFDALVADLKAKATIVINEDILQKEQ